MSDSSNYIARPTEPVERILLSPDWKPLLWEGGKPRYRYEAIYKGWLLKNDWRHVPAKFPCLLPVVPAPQQWTVHPDAMPERFQ